MSTRSYICMEQPDNSYIGIYCHSDGYLTYNGAMLVDHYQNRKTIERLIGLGHLSSLAEKIDPDPNFPHAFDYSKRQAGVCVFYGRDRNEPNQEATTVTLENLAQDPWIEYVYIFGLDNKWRYFEDSKYHKKEDLIDVNEKLEEYFTGLGIKRPEGLYGFFDDRAVRTIRELQKKSK